MATVTVRGAAPQDRDALVDCRCDLWPDGSREEHAEDVDKHFTGEPRSALPLAVLVAVGPNDAVLGFVEVGLRSHADGCDPLHPVGFLEGWYVVPESRRSGIGAALVAAAESWARARGCTEIASDTWADARGDDSVSAHRALGFEVTDRVVMFRKTLAP